MQKLKDTPANIRHELRSGATTGTIKGVVYDRHKRPLPGVTLSLRTQKGGTIALASSDKQGAYQFSVVPGVYDLIIPWLGVVVQNAAIVPNDIDTFDIKDVDTPGNYSVTGRLIDPAQVPVPGQTISIQRRGIVHAKTKTDARGRFSFHPKLAGSYVIATDAAATQIDLTPAKSRITLTLLSGDTAEQRYVVTEKRMLSAKETGHDELIFGIVRDRNGNGINGVKLEMQWADAAPTTKFPHTTTGKVVSKPDGYYQFMHSKGSFLVKIIDNNHESDIADGLDTANVPGRENIPISYQVDFQLLPVIQSAQESVISGSIPGGRSRQLVRLWKDGQVVDKTALNSVKKFRFTALGIGAYDLELAGIGIIETDILLDGHRKENIRFPLMGAIVGAVKSENKRRYTIKLISETYGFIRHGDVSKKGNYRFTHLPAGVYRIELDDNVIPDLKCDGEHVLKAPPLHIIAPEKENSRIEGAVYNADHLPVLVLPVQLQQAGHYLDTAVTAVKGRFVFDSLAPGTYEIAIGDHVYHDNIVLDGENAVAIQITYPDVHIATTSAKKHLARYYLLRMAEPMFNPTSIQFIATHLPTPAKGPIGFDITEAQRAYEVILIGDGIPDSVVRLLKDAHCKIQDMRGDLLLLPRKLKDI
ncbi:MAG: hypothetical protein DSY55_03705 [Clostridia bacterium]|nr:MAG: hypothetical protein DSY55_03705 [Clostridia bacterium]